MQPTIIINLGENESKIESGSLVVNNARLGQVNSGIGNDESYFVFNFKTCKIELWNKQTTKLFKGKITME